MRKYILLILISIPLLTRAQIEVTNQRLEGDWAMIGFNEEGEEKLTGIKWKVNLTDIDVYFETEKIASFNYEISRFTCDDNQFDNNDYHLKLTNKNDGQVECYVLLSFNYTYWSIQSYESSNPNLFKFCSRDSDEDGLKDCEDNYTTFNLDFFANYATQNTDTSLSINGYIGKTIINSITIPSFYDFNGIGIKKYEYNSGLIVYFSPKDLHAMEITGSSYELSNGVKIEDDISVLASNYPTEYTNRNQTTKEVKVAVPITGAPDGTMVFYYDTNNKIIKIAIELRAYR